MSDNMIPSIHQVSSRINHVMYCQGVNVIPWPEECVGPKEYFISIMKWTLSGNSHFSSS